MRQRLERRPETILHFAGAVGYASQLSVIAGEKRHDPIGLSERVCLQYNRVALMESHIGSDANFFENATLKNNTIDVVGLGLNAMDTICVSPVFPTPNTKTHINEVRVQPGGQVATAMTTCARLGLRARYIGSVGGDVWGQRQIASLREEQNLELLIAEVEDAASQVAIILLEEGIGERTILWRRDPKLQYPAQALRRE